MHSQKMHLGKLMYMCQYGNCSAFYDVFHSVSRQPGSLTKRPKNSRCRAINPYVPLCSATGYDWFPWRCYWFAHTSTAVLLFRRARESNHAWIIVKSSWTFIAHWQPYIWNNILGMDPRGNGSHQGDKNDTLKVLRAAWPVRFENI